MNRGQRRTRRDGEEGRGGGQGKGREGRKYTLTIKKIYVSRGTDEDATAVRTIREGVSGRPLGTERKITKRRESSQERRGALRKNSKWRLLLSYSTPIILPPDIFGGLTHHTGKCFNTRST